MQNVQSHLIPLAGVLLFLGSLATGVFAQGGGGPGGGAPAKCDGYCSELIAPACDYPKLKCCCDNAGTWECVCKLATDCTTGNGCQDGGVS